MTEPLRYRMDLAHARNRVWAAWTQADELAKWLCVRATVEPVVGGRCELFWNPDPSRPESDSTIGFRVLRADGPSASSRRTRVPRAKPAGGGAVALRERAKETWGGIDNASSRTRPPPSTAS